MRARPQRLLRFLGAERGLGGREGIGDTSGVLATGLGHVGTTATATVDQARDLLDHVAGMETGLHSVIGAGGEQGRGAFLGHAGNDAGNGAGDLLVHGIPNVAQVGSLKALKFSDNELVAIQLDSTVDGAGNRIGGATSERLLVGYNKAR